MRIRELTEQHYVSIMLELLGREGKKEGLEGIEGREWQGKMKGEGRRENS
jgi:hypothetical protein